MVLTSSLTITSSLISSKLILIHVFNFVLQFFKDWFLEWWKICSDYVSIQSLDLTLTTIIQKVSHTISMTKAFWTEISLLWYLIKNMIEILSGKRDVRRWEDLSGVTKFNRNILTKVVSLSLIIEMPMIFFS